MAQSFCQRVRLLSTGQWSHILKKPLKGCKTPINETYLDQNRTALRILWTEVLEGTETVTANLVTANCLLLTLRALTFENAS
jgi:hypothetical protein